MVSALGGWCLPGPGGCLVQGGVCSGGCLVWGGGGVCSRGVLAWSGGWGGRASQHALRQIPLPPVDRQTPGKILPWPNFVAAGILLTNGFLRYTRLHSSRMRTARTLTVSPSMLCAGGCLVPGGAWSGGDPSIH